MGTLVNVPKNGNLANVNSGLTFPTWSNWIDSFFTNDLPSVFTSNFNTGMTLPKVNIRETSDAYFVDMAVPGLKKSDFHIDLDNQLLSISTEVKEENEHKEDNYTRREFGYSSFKRTFTLPTTADGEKISANYVNGVLRVSIPKKEEAKPKPPKQIAIK